MKFTWRRKQRRDVEGQFSDRAILHFTPGRKPRNGGAIKHYLRSLKLIIVYLVRLGPMYKNLVSHSIE